MEANERTTRVTSESRIHVLGSPEVEETSCAAAGLIHYALDGVGASATLGPAAETGINLAHASCLLGDRRPDLVIAENIAGADDHRRDFLPCRDQHGQDAKGIDPTALSRR